MWKYNNSSCLVEVYALLKFCARFLKHTSRYRFSMKLCIARALVNLRKKSSIEIAYGCDSRMFEQKKTFNDMLWIKRTCWIASILFLIHFWSVDEKEAFSWHIVPSKQVFCANISEFESKFIGHFWNETFSKIWNLGVSAFLYESF